MRFIFGAIFLVFFASPGWSDNADDSLRAYAINVHRTPVQAWPGYGIFLGKGMFITAAHVAGRAWMTRPKVVIAGQEYPTRVVKEGSLEGTDLTLLAIDEALLPMRLRLRRTTLCKAAPWPGEQIVTVIPEGVARSYIIPPDRIPIGARRFSTAIADVARTGNSGSGVFDAQQRCLLGIMSRKISQSVNRPGTGKTETRDIAKYFVPASEIAAFLPADFVL
ncbi:serine protease [Bradyrhizobium lablabi]|uniref:serine protease n=1 Tax=Bradyrhizobium lablabi TaxID=722472 RepID=UPI00090A127A|nr:serine protease [Bradyrhizobium lablabi]SHM85471.1 hypothetical protein SAMN05444321_7913 [Bradyrhizobium lablabi]